MCLVKIYAPKEQHHGKEDIDCEAELLGEHEAADNGREHVGRGSRVFLHDVVQLLQDCRHHEASNTSEEQRHYKKNFDAGACVTKGRESVERIEVRSCDKVDRGGDDGSVEVKPELLLEEVFSRCFEKGLCVHSRAHGVAGSNSSEDDRGERDRVGEVAGEDVANLGDDDGGDDQESAHELKSRHLALENEFVKRGGDDCAEGAKNDPDGGRHQHQSSKVDVVVHWDGEI